MATEVTVYVTSDGKRYKDLEEASIAQSSLNKASSRDEADEYIDAFIDAAAQGGSSKWWKSMSIAKNTKSRRIKVSGSNLGEIMRGLINDDMVSLYNLAIAIGVHTFELPKDLSRPTIPGKDGDADEELPGGLLAEKEG